MSWAKIYIIPVIWDVFHIQGSHFSWLTKFPNFFLTFPVFFSIFQYLYNVLFFLNLKLYLSILANNTQFI